MGMQSNILNLMHADLTCTTLCREEVLFIGLALSMSKTMLSLHLSGNTLSYYDRIFLRSLIAARVGFRFKSDAEKDKIKNNKEFTNIMHLASHNNYSDQIKDYINVFNDLDQEREGMDFEIQELLDDLDTKKEFNKLDRGMDPKKLPEGSKLKVLIDKMALRHTKLV